MFPASAPGLTLGGTLASPVCKFIRKQTPVYRESLFHSKLGCFTLNISIRGSKPKPTALTLDASYKGSFANVNGIRVRASRELST